MAINVSNQKPVRLNPYYDDRIGKDYDPIKHLEDIIVTPIMTPIMQGSPVVIKQDSQTLTEADILDKIRLCMDDTMDVKAEAEVREILGETLQTYNKNTNLLLQDVFLVQSGTAAKLPEPNDRVIYTAGNDVIPACRQFITGQCDYDYFFASFGYFARPETLGFYFINENSFDAFIQWFAQQMLVIGAAMPPDTMSAAADFQKLTLTGLTESLLLRHDQHDNNDPNSFARLVTHMLMNYTKVAGPGEFGILPFHLSDVICPKTITFVNVEKHSRATTKQIVDEWKIIKQSIQKKPTMISNNKLTKLTAQARNLQKITNAANAASKAYFSKGGNIIRNKNVRFRKTAPSGFDLARAIKKVMDKMSFVNQSMNVFRVTTTTFAKPNRRDPDDWNKKGKSTTMNYKPDIHVYIDTSGSISEIHYQESIKLLIFTAKKLNVNIYFNSFSHVMSQTTRLSLQNKSVKEIYAEFQKVPKVGGGTDFEQIWHFINSSKKRSQEFSLIITDFEWTAPTEYIKHPENLYYIPCSNKDWDTIKYWAGLYCKSMFHNDPNFRKHILF